VPLPHPRNALDTLSLDALYIFNLLGNAPTSSIRGATRELVTDRFSKMDGYFDGTLGSDPVRQDRPHHGLDLSTLEGAVLIPKSDCRNNTARDEMRRLAARRLPGVGFLESGTSHGKSVHWGLSRGCNTTARAFCGKYARA
jgi:hypothetical protein